MATQEQQEQAVAVWASTHAARVEAAGDLAEARGRVSAAHRLESDAARRATQAIKREQAARATMAAALGWEVTR